MTLYRHRSADLGVSPVRCEKGVAKTLGLVLLISLLFIGCQSIFGGSGLADGQAEVPDSIVQDFLAHPHFSTYKTKPADLKWQVYSEEASRRVVAATFRTKDSRGQEGDWYYLAAYRPESQGNAPERLYGALASIDDPDFDVSGFSVSSVNGPDGRPTPTLVATGFAVDPKVVKVMVETSESRTLDATMYERFWMVVSEAVSSNERVTKTIGCAEDGTRLYVYPPFVLAEGAHAVS